MTTPRKATRLQRLTEAEEDVRQRIAKVNGDRRKLHEQLGRLLRSKRELVAKMAMRSS